MPLPCHRVRQRRYPGELDLVSGSGSKPKNVWAKPKSKHSISRGALRALGTKDPKASDTLYIEALAAPFTVNTMSINQRIIGETLPAHVENTLEDL